MNRLINVIIIIIVIVICFLAPIFIINYKIQCEINVISTKEINYKDGSSNINKEENDFYNKVLILNEKYTTDINEVKDNRDKLNNDTQSYVIDKVNAVYNNLAGKIDKVEDWNIISNNLYSYKEVDFNEYECMLWNITLMKSDGTAEAKIAIDKDTMDIYELVINDSKMDIGSYYDNMNFIEKDNFIKKVLDDIFINTSYSSSLQDITEINSDDIYEISYNIGSDRKIYAIFSSDISSLRIQFALGTTNKRYIKN